MTVALPAGVVVLERGWLSSNNVLLHGGPDEGALLIDSGHCLHAAQTLALVTQALAGVPLARIVNTHLHSDHCGGNASLQRALGAEITVPRASWRTVQAWDEDALSYRATGQLCERFRAQSSLAPGEALQVGGRRWQALAAPGHDPQSLMLFDERDGVLVSADALWENGFGVVFPELDGVDAFDEVAAVLDLIERLPVRVVLPGHGAPFDDVAGALSRARSRLAGFRADPLRHARHGAKVLLKYHLMEQRSQDWAGLLAWAEGTRLFAGIGRQLGWADASAGCRQLVAELAGQGALRADEAGVHDA
ncbi:MBL fold metallo-hydrolase [Rhizobacter sp. SG703]|uniref:MBL fold metallo-hydrolase n=1 Tax=Rhizobacter sp. SG703 TaxID=2587140 RepID=UPI0014481E1B|nr:MBL fold metallo-hydrolase [Rhizobacter sp. SG703]NKI95702.1 glyoxylase-like metal-dependent hydrolase (beta-lactamase superfamily II) [Rhizobacter sp. SG703]